MASESNVVLRQMLHRLGSGGEERADADLLDAFRTQGDENAFTALVERHGPMVLAVCRRLLGTEHDAEDAFQATFLVLARKASALDGQRTLASWLYTVAHNLAVDARIAAARRKRHERDAGSAGVSKPTAVAEGQEVQDVLDNELTRLPAKYRAPLVLCYLEGKSHDEAARALGWPRGSMAKRLARGQEMLKQRLVRRGVALTTAAACLSALGASQAAVAPGLVASTTRAALTFAAGNSAAGVTPAAQLAQGALKKMYWHKFTLATVSAALFGCTLLGTGYFLQQTFAEEQKSGQASKPARDPNKPLASLEIVKKTVDGGNEFAFDLYGELSKKEGNLFLSPYSVSTALAMTSAGARGATETEMVKALHLLPEPAQRHPGFGELIRLTQRDEKKDKGVQLSVANALWGMEGYRFLEPFLATTGENYGAGLRRVNFGNSEAARKTINGWVERKTSDKIKDLIPSGVLDSDTRLVLTNAIYFKGNWASQFKKEATREQPFFVAAATQVKAPLMYQTGDFRFYQDKSLQALELPYVGNNLNMVVLLPLKKDGLAEVEKSMNAGKLKTILGKMYKTEVDVVLPRFKTRSKFGLNKPLTELGMTSAFVDGRADLSGLDGKKDLYISHVIHEGFVDVNEEGTEAAAATAVVVATESVKLTKRFRADHPFLFLIRDNTTGSILFLGRLVNPMK